MRRVDAGSGGTLLRGTGLFLLLVLLHYATRPLLGGRVTVDFLVIGVVVTAVRIRPGAAALVGLGTGMVADSLVPLSFGAGGLAMSVVAFITSWLKAAVFGESLLPQAIAIAAAKWIHDLVYLVAAREHAAGEMVAQILVWSPLTALATGVAGLLVLSLTSRAMDARR